MVIPGGVADRNDKPNAFRKVSDMSDALTLPAEARERGGKGASRQLRREGRVPAVIYGGKEAPQMIHVEAKELVRQLGTGHFMNSIVEIKLGGKTVRTLPKDVAVHPVSDRPEHVDFFRLAKGAKVDVNVPVVFANEEKSPGLKKGGVLNVVRHELELVCDAYKIPSEITIDVTGKDVGDSIHISEVTLPEGSESAITDRDFTIATLVAPSALKKAEGAEAAAEVAANDVPSEQASDDDAATEEEAG
jgi:large subunit ribosomal protein L25